MRRVTRRDNGLGIRAGCFPCKNIRKETLPEQSPLEGTNLTPAPLSYPTPLSPASSLSVNASSSSSGFKNSLAPQGTKFSTSDMDNDNCMCKCAQMMSGGGCAQMMSGSGCAQTMSGSGCAQMMSGSGCVQMMSGGGGGYVQIMSRGGCIQMTSAQMTSGGGCAQMTSGGGGGCVQMISGGGCTQITSQGGEGMFKCYLGVGIPSEAPVNPPSSRSLECPWDCTFYRRYFYSNTPRIP